MDEQPTHEHPRDDEEETIRDLDVPADDADAVAGGADGRLKWGDIVLKRG